MKFKLDENLPVEIASEFRSAGHNVDTVHDEGLSGQADTEILHQAQIVGRILLTMDKGIADVRLFPPASYPGIVLYRPSSTGRGEVLQFIRESMGDLLSMEISGRLVVVSPRGIRSR